MSRQLAPAALGFCAREVESTCETLRGATHGAGQRLWMDRRRHTLGIGLRGRRLAAAMMMGKQANQHRAHHRGVHQRAHCRSSAGTDLVEGVAGFGEL